MATFTIDHLAYSLSPPVVGVIVDFDGGGRYRCEMTDVDARELAIGDRVEMTFRRVYTAQGVHNYFWKARPAHRRRPDRPSEGSVGAWRAEASATRWPIIGMGCTPFGELWDKGVDDLLTDAATEASASAGIAARTTSTPSGSGTMTSGVCGSPCRARSSSTTSR